VSSVPAQLIYRVNDLELDIARGCLSRNGEEIHLKPKAFQILVYLMAHRERLVSKEELLDQFWKDTAVSDDILAQSIAEVRRALGDSSRDSIYLKTFPKRGYRFVAGVQEVRPEGLIATEQITTVQVREEYSDEGSRRFGLRWLVAGTLVLAALGVLVWWWQAHPGLPAPAGGKRQIAVLRFENRTGQGDLDWLADGLPDMLTTTLSRSPMLDVLSREQVGLWMGHANEARLKGAMDLARRSQAQIAILGSFARLGAKVRIDAQVYDGRKGSLLTAESIVAENAEQILTQVDSMAARLVVHLSGRPPREKGPTLSSLMTDNLQAYRYYSLGLRKAETFQTHEAVELLKRAAALDPNFAMAYARIGYAYLLSSSNLEEGRLYLEKAYQMAGKLTDKDRRYILAWYAIANQDYPDAIRKYSELIENYPYESEAYHQLARLLRGESRHEEAAGVLRRGLTIYPDESELWNALAAVSSEMGRHEEAIRMAQRFAELEPGEANAYDTLGLAYEFAGSYEKALEAFSKALSIKPDFEIAGLHRANVYAAMGREKDALRECQDRSAAAQSGFDRWRYGSQAAWIYWRRGAIGRARAAILKADQDQPKGHESWNPAELLVASGPATGTKEITPVPGRASRFGLRTQFFFAAQDARRRNRPEEMVANLREALRYRPEWGSSEPLEDALADGYMALGRLDEAIAEYERGLKLFPGTALAHFHLAEAYRRKANSAGAKTQFRQFLDLWKHADPSLPELAEARRWAH
jgi:DNA-binding winged helix-turn-helix (wHTH) protein/tetratricopeptide (TPR) repeat protein